MDEPTTRDLIIAEWAQGGTWTTPRSLAPWFGRDAGEIRQELERMESEGLAGRWQENPGDEWRFGPTDEGRKLLREPEEQARVRREQATAKFKAKRDAGERDAGERGDSI